MSMYNELSSLRHTEEKEENFFIRFFKYFVPWKGDGLSEIFRKLVFIASIVVFCYSMSDLSEYLSGNAKTNQLIDEMQEIKPTVNSSDDAQSITHEGGSQNNGNTDAPPAGSEENYSTEIGESWNSLLEINEDVVGWITIETMKDSSGELYIDYPIVQGENNDYYLNRDIKKNYSSSGGTIFLDYASNVVPGQRTDNITIFGHNMKAGTFFGRLDEYKSGVEFLKNNPLITFNTLYSTYDEKYIIVGCFLANVEEDQDNGTVFRYVGYRNFDSKHPFETWKAEMEKRSWYSSSIPMDESDKYITLSTCSADIDNMRWVIVARKLRSGENVDELVATYEERDDADIYFPQRWIYSWGNKKVYRN